AGTVPITASVAAVTRPQPAASQRPSVQPQVLVIAFLDDGILAPFVLEGLAVEDFDLIEKGAQDLALASQASSWQVLQTEDYARHSDEFRRSCNALRAAAKARNLDGAALAWMEVTMKCIQCHKYVRDAERGR
ncbi:MAG: hypothetical protein ACKONH_12160, partial [Planctomycetia bacterium]